MAHPRLQTTGNGDCMHSISNLSHSWAGNCVGVADDTDGRHTKKEEMEKAGIGWVTRKRSREHHVLNAVGALFQWLLHQGCVGIQKMRLRKSVANLSLIG